MAKVYLKKNAKLCVVGAELRLMGIVMKQRLADGSYVVYKSAAVKRLQIEKNKENNRL